MALSRDWTAKKAFDQALIELSLDQNCASYAQRLDLVNRAFSTVANMFYDLMSNAYMTPVTIVPDTIGRYSSSGTGTWTVATSTLVFAGMNTSFGSGDVGKTIAFRVGSLVYLGQVASFVSTTSVTITGMNLPVTNVTVDYVLLVATTPTGNNVSLSTLRFMRTGQPIKLELESTATDTLEATTSQSVFKFDGAPPQNVKKIVWAYSGDELLLAKGDGLTTYGTFTLRYPRVPNKITADTDFIDIPDGAAFEVGFIYLKAMIAKREGKMAMMQNYEADLGSLIKSMYNTFGQEVQAEHIANKVKSLK